MSVKQLLSRKVGPLPVAGWAAALVGGVAVAMVIRRQAINVEHADAYAQAQADEDDPWALGGNTGTNPGGVYGSGGGGYADGGGNDDDGEALAALEDSLTGYRDDMTGLGDVVADLGDQVNDLYTVIGTDGTPEPQGGGGRRDHGTPNGTAAPVRRPKPAPSVHDFRQRFDRAGVKRLNAIEARAVKSAKAIRVDGVQGHAEARRLAVAVNRAKAARREKRERQRNRRKKK